MGQLDPLPDDIGKPGGLLNDEEIRLAITKGYLLKKETTDDNQVKQSSYELRVGNAYEVLTYKDSKIVHEKRHVEDGESIKIAPGCTFKILIKEELWIPPNVLAHVYVLGQFFACGLAAEHTFADPGFCHNEFYITMSNVSSRALSIKPGTPIAKLQFHRLGSPVQRLHAGRPRPIENFVQYEKPSTLEQIRQLEKNDILKQIALHGTPHVETAYVIETLIKSIARIKFVLYVLAGLTILPLASFLLFKGLMLLPPDMRNLFIDKELIAIVGGLFTSAGVVVALKKELKNTWHQAFRQEFRKFEN